MILGALRWSVFSLATSSLLVGCAGREASLGAVTTDSAGIAIVASVPPARIDTIGPAPVWRVEASVGASDQILLGASDISATPSGGLIIANAGNDQVVALRPDGTTKWRFGRRGEGPGEFTGSVSLAMLGDTVLAFDFVTRKLVRITPEGLLGGVLQVALPDPNLKLLMTRPDGALVFTSRHLLGPTEGINRDSVVYLAVRPDGTRIGELGWGRQRNIDFVMGEYGPNMHDQGFGPTGAVTPLGSGLAHADGDRPEVVRRDAMGRVTHLLRWHEELVPVTDADREELGDARRAVTADEFRRMQLEEWLERATWSKTKPVSGLLVGSPDGVLLVAGHCSGRQEGCAWREFDSAGVFRRTLWLPIDAESAVLAGDLLVTLSSDEQGLERLQAWRLPEF